MLPFLLRRIGAGLVLVVVVTAITFFMTYGAGIPVARNILGPSAGADQVAALNHRLGLDQPLLEQYWSWVTGVLHGDLGTSYFTNQPVGDALGSRLPVTLSVVLLACAITVAARADLGLACAARGGIVDTVLQAISTSAYVFPAIVLGIVMVSVFAINLGWLPATGYVEFADAPWEWFTSVLLPAIVLSIGGIAALAANVRGALIDVLSRE